MKKKSKSTRTFDELVSGYYGDASRMRPASARFDELLGRYYGAPAAASGARGGAARRTVRSLSCDDGEVLPRRPGSRAPREYVLSLSVDAGAHEEYIVGTAPGPIAETASLAAEAASAEQVAPAQEYLVDVLAPLGDPGPAATLPDPRIEPASAAPVPALAPAQPPAPLPAQNAAHSASLPPPLRRMADEPPAQASEDDFMADMKSILTGQKVFDPASGRTVERERSAAAPGGRNGLAEPAAPEMSSSQAIFDRIARSMEYANAFDLGTVELNNRFSDFDRIAELQQKAVADKRTRAARAPSAEPAPAASDTSDFMADLEAIRGAKGEAPEAGTGYSRPFYDTGEHVLTADDLYVDKLHVGPAPGVPFSYGQIIAMGDMYESVQQMMAAPADELRKLKSLIERSTAYHRGHRANASLDVSDEMWDAATRDRYLELAEQNYPHFSPSLLFKKATLVQRGDHRVSWERHHRQALDEARKIYADPQYANASVFLERPLITNAFGDHFLTDAFSAGHVINKQEIIERFKESFYSGTALRSEAEAFFERVAALAFKGEVRKKFSALETYEPVFLWWNPNIDSESAFRKLLIKAAEQQPDTIANLAVKALHDRLNQDGVEVENDVAAGPWTLTGDSHLDTKNLGLLRAAVKQSVANVEDPGLRDGSADANALVARVWKHVPRPTARARTKLIELAGLYTRPDSTVLREAAADLIAKRVDSLIKKLKKEKKLKDA